ncbi:hypothetical protein [Parachlamydia acanthamoebae]|uniref:Uncharacterized protein n=2 Tax=Parachlamydia acanthamoebae TaxID=83552 RepID=F8KW17_PARAV|nr:hypothetical protein [Parachlamydia acanthamoebae]KIA76304.1 hypothetical protein DB43_AM00190 [Parachlamydia acanthamoebae]CCB85240.1 putative uncharacterized protein [Parachlamydia acanthamoebae UV-7]
MWAKEYRDYPPDTTLKKYRVEPSQGIVGCEMHEINGWGNRIHIPLKKKRKGLISSVVNWLFSFGTKKENE